MSLRDFGTDVKRRVYKYMERIAQITRNTNETKINMTLNLDGSGKPISIPGSDF